MRNIEILGETFEVLDYLENISISDSFVMPQNKVGEGNGEAKLYLGYVGDTLTNFFGKRGFKYDSYLLREDLLNYLNEVRREHLAPTQEYREKNRLDKLWQNKYEKVIALPKVISFKIEDQNNIQGQRLYINSSSVGYKLIRELALPVISHLNIKKIRNISTGEIVYYFYLFSDFLNDVIEEDEITPEDNEFEPFNPDLISIDTKKFTMDTLLRRLKQGTINLYPDFQRNLVWTIEKKCQLIESLMLKIPLPMFYVSADNNGNYTVIDGLQRISTFQEFMITEKFKLQKLEFWGSKFNDLSFEELPIFLSNRILETEFTFTVINEGTPEALKRNIFKRVNRGGEPLTDQEIRNALYSGNSTAFLRNLADCDEFIQVTENSIKESRMLDREFILRLLSFLVRSYKNYPKNGNMDEFLSGTLKIINMIPNFNNESIKGISTEEIIVKDIALLKNLFIIGMKRGLEIFGEHAFRKSFPGRRKSQINKSLFEVWGVLLSTLSELQYSSLIKNKNNFLKNYYNLFLKDTKFDTIISRNALKQSSVVERHKKLSDFLNLYTND